PVVSPPRRSLVCAVLSGDGLLPADFPVDRLLGAQLLLRPDSGVASILGQHLHSRRDQRIGRRQPVPRVRRDVPPAPILQPPDRRRTVLIFSDRHIQMLSFPFIGGVMFRSGLKSVFTGLLLLIGS